MASTLSTRLLLTLLLVGLVTPAQAADQWVLWRKTSEFGNRTVTSKPATIGLHESKDTCLIAAKQTVIDIREGYIRIATMSAKSMGGQLLGNTFVDTGERSEPGLLKNGQGYVATFRKPASTKGELVDTSYFFFGECWPVGVTPQ